MSEELEQSAQKTETDVDETVDEAVGTTDENADSSNEAEFSDDAEAGERQPEQDPKAAPKQEEKKPQKTNADYARERREAEQKAAIQKAKIEATIEALGGVNPYTQEPIEDEADVKQYLTMKEIEKAGKDPIADYASHIRGKEKEQVKAAQEKSGQEEWLRKDREAFVTKHPDVKLTELVGDEMFKTFAKGKVGSIPMTQIYSEYQAFEKLSDERAKTKAAQILANNAATPGKLSNETPAPAKSVATMSKAEFEQYIERVKSGERIQI
jgi:hypothetical protein